MSVLVTGGAGFIGRHLVLELIGQGQQTHVWDNLSSGRIESLDKVRDNPAFKFRKIDLLDENAMNLPRDCDSIWHLAANPEVRISATMPQVHFSQNVEATFNLLEAARKNDTKNFIFASTSTVYGDADLLPTPENYSPLEPISMYGASKLACESIIISYAHTYGMRAVIYRLANIIGEDSDHGVIPDFVKKLQKDPSELEVLGDGTQNKSYLYISDCISAMLTGASMARSKVNVLNVGSEDQIMVQEIARTVIDEMGLSNTRLNFARGVENGRGWKGDVKNMLLDCSRLKSLGWAPRYRSLEAVRVTTRRMIQRLVYPR